MANPSDMEITLTQLGLEQLVDRFHAEDIDDALFWKLNLSDLKELGLTLGQRKRLSAAISAQGSAGKDVRAPTQLRDGLELRRLTVLFIDMIGSTPLAEQVSPDDMHDLLQSFYQTAGDIAQRFGGYVASYLGDGIIMLFGYPGSRPGDAERALRAALAMQAELATDGYALPFSGDRVSLAFRIGLATGPAIIGLPDEIIAGDKLRMVGQVMNRAARLQTECPAGGVMVDGDTRGEVGFSFRLEHRPDVVLKGIQQGGGVYQLAGESGPDPDASLPDSPRTKVLGRSQETARILHLWSKAAQGNGYAAILSGAAGIGKTALLRDIVAQISGQTGAMRWLACSPLEKNSAFGPIVALLSRLTGTGDTASQEAALDQILQDVPQDEAAMIAGLLGLSATEPAESRSAAETRTRLIGALADWLIGQSQSHPTLIVLEDAHWCDATTREVLAACGEKAEGLAVMLLATSRNEQEPLWDTAANHETLLLGHLDDSAARALITTVANGQTLPDAIVNRLLELGAGNPLMLESLTRAAMRNQTAYLGPDVVVPRSIYEFVAEQIDTLEAGRPLAAALSVLDSASDRQTLAAVLDWPLNRIDLGVQELAAAHLVTETGTSLKFFHQQYRDVVYERIVGTKRRNLHRAYLNVLLAQSPDITDSRPDLVAIHALSAGESDLASKMALQAGEQLLAKSAVIEADFYLENALSALDGQADKTTQKPLRLRVLGALASVKRARLGIASDEVGQLGSELLELARDLGDNKAELLALSGLYAHALVGADYRKALAWGSELAEVSRLSQDRRFTMIGQRALGVVALHTSRIDVAASELELALAAYNADRDLELAYAHGYDHAEICAVFLAFAHWMRGDLQEARRVSQFSVDHSRQIDHAHSLAQALSFRAMLGALAVDADDIAEAGTEAITMGDRFGMKVMRSAGWYFRDAARLLARATPATCAEFNSLTEAHNEFLAVNPFNYGPMAASISAQILLRAGKPDRAEKALDQAEIVQERTGETWVAAEIIRLRASIAGARGKTREAADLHNAALDLATTSGAVTLALRIACDMAEAAPEQQALDRMNAVAARMVSLDDGWDIRRWRALTATIQAG